MASGIFQIDEGYEFSAPRFFDFLEEETQEEITRAEIWFEISHSHAPSPFMPKIKERPVKIETLCDFGEVEMEIEKDGEHPDQSTQENDIIHHGNNALEESRDQELRKEEQDRISISFGCVPNASGDACATDSQVPRKETSIADSARKETPSFEFPVQAPRELKATDDGMYTPHVVSATVEKPPKHTKVENVTQIHTKRMTILAGNSSTRKTPLPIQSQNGKPKNLAARDIAQENQAVKRQKLDGGRTRQIMNVKSVELAHKCAAPNVSTSSTPFVSAAEVIKRFESRTRDLGISQYKNLLLRTQKDPSQATQRPRLVLTRPKEPELQTSQRVRAIRVKSSEELEAEMLAKIPKFKARPFNKKILEAPPIPPVNRSTHQPPEFKEFNFKTSERASRHGDASSEASSVTGFTFHSQKKPLKLTEARPPQLETSLRARPPKAKSSQELELEELEKAPKFKARPLNRKILDRKLDAISIPVPKPPLTTPKEFHFATDERLGPAASVLDQFEKLSMRSESSYHSQKLNSNVPGFTIPNPFNLHTEERGFQKEMSLQNQLTRKQEEEFKARVPKATPYPYTTDYPVLPPKPEPKPCTKPEGFQLESLVRHEEETRRHMEEIERLERENAQKRIFRAQPILKEDPLPVPVKERKPLTEVQAFSLHVDQRSTQRQEFDNKIKEKEVMYKRLREEGESAKQMEEEKALKQMRRTMVPHARPLPKFENPFMPQRSTKEATKPKSPHLHVDERGEIRRQKTHTFMR